MKETGFHLHRAALRGGRYGGVLSSVSTHYRWDAARMLRSRYAANLALRNRWANGSAAGGRINHQAMRLVLRELGLDYDGHGFRTTSKFWAPTT